MTLETFKSLVLVALVSLSLLLTYTIWTFQPNYDRYKSDLKYVGEADLGGDIVTKKSVIKPYMTIFHMDEQYLGFRHPGQADDFFTNIQDYTLTNYTLTEPLSLVDEKYAIELMFPESLPLDMIKSIFTLEDPEMELPTWSYKEMYLIFDENDPRIDVHFVSTESNGQASFTIESTRAITYLWSKVINEDNLEPYFLVEELAPKIYLPVNQPSIQSRTIAIERILPSKLVDALFANPSIVSPNVGEAYYTDGQRGMRVLDDRKSIEYINPIQSSYERMEKIQLLDESISKINDHAGWTNDFYLDTVVASINQVIYRMHYDNYPIFHHGDLAIIDHQWRQQDVYKYKRPIFYLKSSFGGNFVQLESGEDLIEHMQNQLENNIEHVRDIRLGYQLIYYDNEPYSVLLQPAWFMNYNGQWQAIRIIESELDEGGV